MADSIRQQIIALVKERFQSIRTANSYETELGAHVFVWRDLDKVPVSEAELPLLNIRDLRRETEPQVSGRADHHHTLFLELEIVAGVTNAGGNTDAAVQVRKCISDLEEAINAVTNGWAGTYWANSTPDANDPTKGTKLAFLTLPMDDEMVVDQSGRTISGAKMRIKIQYRNQRWNPYEQ
jgi:hypothetical protein